MEVSAPPTFFNESRLNLTDEMPPLTLQPLDNHTQTQKTLPTPSSPTGTTHTASDTQVSPVSPVSSDIPPHSTQPNTPPGHTTHPSHKTNSARITVIPNPPNKAETTLPETTSTISTTNTSASQRSSTSSPSQPNEGKSIKPFSSPSPEATVKPGTQPQTSSPAQHQSLSTQPSSPSAQAKENADTPSRLNVGGDATVVHEAPSLDPLLGALVSAFIVAAVIITLLVFLKLRRRDDRPEFRRLQDLPMDDMMEDTPLSMYTY
ncbi:uncharacterized protein FYW47_008651 [Aplochiton taeniatus]